MAAPLFAPRNYQRTALEEIAKAEARGVRRPLVTHPTGTGKTVLFSHLIAQRGGRAVVLVHRDELLTQAVDKLRIIAPGVEIGVVKAARDEKHAQVVVASVQTLHERRLPSFPRDFHTVVVDEAHHSVALTYRAVLDHLGAFHDDGPLTLGVTATPERGDGAGLDGVWQEVVHEYPMIDAIVEGNLVDVRGQAVGTDADFSKIHVRAGDLVESEIGAELERSGALGQIAGAYAKYAGNRTGVAFLPSVATAHGLAAELVARGIAAEAIDGGMAIEDRRDILHRLHTGETQVVPNCQILTEGFDESSISCIVIARPTRSHGLFVQMIGRGTRPHPGKADLLVLDVSGASERHDLVSVADLAGVAKLGNRTLAEAATEAATQPERDYHEIERATATKAVDLFRSRLKWLPVDEGWVLPAGDASIVLVPRGEDWAVIGVNQTTDVIVHEALPIGYAQGYGESVAKRSGGSLSKRDARWNGLDPTAAQMRWLRGRGLRADVVVSTRGAASDLISRIKARPIVKKYRQTEEVAS